MYAIWDFCWILNFLFPGMFCIYLTWTSLSMCRMRCWRWLVWYKGIDYVQTLAMLFGVSVAPLTDCRAPTTTWFARVRYLHCSRLHCETTMMRNRFERMPPLHLTLRLLMELEYPCINIAEYARERGSRLDEVPIMHVIPLFPDPHSWIISHVFSFSSFIVSVLIWFRIKG